MSNQEVAERASGARGGDPLGAMYIVAAVGMGVAALVVVVLMFLPSDLFDGRDDADVWVPGSIPAWAPPSIASGVSEPVGVREIAPGRYRVVMEAVNWSFRPNEIRLPAGAEVTFRAQSLEDYHGIAIIDTPIVFSLEQNEAKEATHVFEEPGEYLIVCSEYCGSGHISMLARVLVEE
jgi:heme/copper-type cytochrome/quinol oxidase subunit 2